MEGAPVKHRYAKKHNRRMLLENTGIQRSTTDGGSSYKMLIVRQSLYLYGGGFSYKTPRDINSTVLTK